MKNTKKNPPVFISLAAAHQDLQNARQRHAWQRRSRTSAREYTPARHVRNTRFAKSGAARRASQFNRFQLADCQWALNGLLMRSASAVMSPMIRSFSASGSETSFSAASLARSAWPDCAERATEKNRSSEKERACHPSIQPRREMFQAVARGLPCRIWT